MATREVVSQAHHAMGIGVPVAVTSVTLLGVGLQDWVYIATLLVAATQIIRSAFACWCWWQRRKSRHPAPTVPESK